MIECIKQEPRIASILSIDVQPGDAAHRDEVDVQMSLQVKGVPDPLSLVIPFSFAGPLS